MTINLQKPDITELKPRINVFGVGGGGGNAVNNMINAGLQGVEFVVANTDAQALTMSRAERVIQLGAAVTEGLGAGSHPEVGRAAAEECLDEILEHLANSHMVFVTAGMGGGTGTGAAPVIARAAREKGLLTVGVVTKPFHFEGQRRMKTAEAGIEELQRSVDTLIVIPNQNLFRIANEKTTFSDAFAMADQVLYSGVASITDLMVREGLINLDFADVRSVMHDMGKAMMGTGEASDQGRALAAAEAAIANPLLDETSMRGARGLLISITGGRDMTLFEVDEAANRIREEVDPEANVIFGAIVDEALAGVVRVSVVATGIDRVVNETVPQPRIFSIHPHPVKKIEASAPIEARSEFPHHSKALMEVMEALEEEMAGPMDERFRPQRQIFGKMARNVSVSHAGCAAQDSPAVTKPLSTQQPETSKLQSSLREKRGIYPQMPTIEEVSSNVKPNEAVGNCQHEQEGHGPKNLWRRLTQRFIYRGDEEPFRNFEPAVSKKLTNNMRPVPLDEGSNPCNPRQESEHRPLSRETGLPHYNYRLKSESDTPFHPLQQLDEKEDEKLEIPAFLRRHIN